MAKKTEDKEHKITEQPETPATASPTTILPHLASRLFGTPLALSQNKLNVVMSVMFPRLSGEMKFDAAQPAASLLELAGNACDVDPFDRRHGHATDPHVAAEETQMADPPKRGDRGRA